ATFTLFYVLLRELAVSKEGSLAAVLIAAFYPRHATVYYFWSASQDAFMALFLIASFISWIRFRKNQSRIGYCMSLIFFALALGFKEPAICFPGLLLGWDVLRLGRAWRRIFETAFWRPYIGLALVVAVFAGFIAWYPEGRLRRPDPYGIYGFFGLQR